MSLLLSALREHPLHGIGTPLARWLRRGFRRLGWPGALGGVLLILAVVAGTLAQGRADEARTALSRERTQLMRVRLAEPVVPPNDRARLEAFYTTAFHGESALAERLSVLYGAAARQGIAIRRVDYRTADEPGTPLRRVALLLPVQGDFARIHAWLSTVLVELPELGLEAISLQRPDSGSSTVEAELRLVLYVGAGR